MPRNELRRKVKKTATFFCNNTSIYGCKFLAEDKLKNNALEGVFWICWNLLIFGVTTYFLYYMWKVYEKNPVVATPDSLHEPIYKINFPGVAVCSINKISKRKAVRLAEDLNKFNSKQSVPALLEKIKLLGHFYGLASSDVEELSSFQKFLNAFDNSSEGVDPSARMLELSPSCEEILKECRWTGKKYPCSDIFFTFITFDGFCCAFNYIRPNTKSILLQHGEKYKRPNSSKLPKSPGIENGLQFTLNDDYEDYFFTSMDSIGYMVYVFYPYDFPDKIGGTLSEVLVSYGTEALIGIDVKVVRSSEEMRALPIRMRTCKFSTDENTVFGMYRDSDCFVECKLNSMRSLCKCLPFVLPFDNGDFCRLTDLPCLNKYKNRWTRHYPQGTDMSEFNLEQVESMSCPNCYPICNTVIFNVFNNIIPAKSGNNTYVKVFLNREFGDLLKNDVIMSWFEIISNFGGLISIFMGWSVISLIEIIFFISKIIWLSFIKT